jgi:hypothetical protein
VQTPVAQSCGDAPPDAAVVVVALFPPPQAASESATQARIERRTRTTGVLSALSQERLGTDGKDDDAEEAGHVLRKCGHLTGLQEVVEVEEIDREKPEDERHVECSSHA